MVCRSDFAAKLQSARQQFPKTSGYLDTWRIAQNEFLEYSSYTGTGSNIMDYTVHMFLVESLHMDQLERQLLDEQEKQNRPPKGDRSQKFPFVLIDVDVFS